MLTNKRVLSLLSLHSPTRFERVVVTSMLDNTSEAHVGYFSPNVMQS